MFASRDSTADAQRIEGVGSIGADTRLDHATGNIASVRLHGDFFALRDVADAMLSLAGAPPDAAPIAALLGPDPLVAGMDNHSLATLIAASALH